MSMLNPVDEPSYNTSGSNNTFGHNSTSGFGGSHTAGPHASNTANEMDPRVDSDRSSTGFNRTHQSSVPGNGLGHAGSNAGFGGASGYDRTTGPASGTAGPHNTNVANEADPRVDSDMSSGRNFSTHDRTTGPASSTAGPHNSNVANEADPRVDSDLNRTGAHHSMSGNSRTTGPASSTAGPHSSNVANEADPRVDSDMSNSRHVSTHDRTTGPASSTAGPHSSNVANEADPRVDSDMSSARHSTTTGGAGASTKGAHINTSLPNALGHEGNIRGSITGQANEGVAGVIPIEGNAGPTTTKVFEPHAHADGGDPARSGPHASSTANKMDPRVDSDRDNRARHENMAGSSYNTPGSGRASHTAGPHDSNVGNKVDPTVDSDMDGSHAGAQRV